MEGRADGSSYGSCSRRYRCINNQAAREHGVPASTLKGRISGRVVHATKPGPVPYLNSKEEDESAAYLVKSSQLWYGKTRCQVKGIVEKVAIERGTLRSPRVSDGWWRRFLERHPRISLRSGDATAHVRMNAINRDNLKHYFGLKQLLEENDLVDHPEHVYNMDEIGVPLDPKPPKVVALKGQKKIRYWTSGQKSKNGSRLC